MEEGKYRLKKLINELDKIRGRHTELVSVYIPAGYSITDVINQLRSEQGTAQNIKSKTTRKNVLGALEKTIQHLKLYKQTPENGLALFCGNVAEKEGESDIRLWAIEPPEPLRVKLYWCDQVFRLEPLKEMVKEKEVYGLVVLDTNEASIGILRGKAIKVLRHLSSIVPGKTAKGGQSAARFARVRAGLLHDWLKHVAEQARELIPEDVRGVLVGGPGPIKKQWIDEGYIPNELKKKLLAVKDTGYADEQGLQELIERSKDVLVEAAITKEKALMHRFFEHLKKGTGLVTYGLEPVIKALEAGAIEIILVSEDAPYVELELEDAAGHSEKRFICREDVAKPQQCKICGQQMGTMGQRDIIEALEDLAKQYGSKIEIISKETPEGEKLLALGGLAAILRYRLD